MGLMTGHDGALPNPRGLKLTYETIKRSLYERTGVSEYWVADPELDVIRVYRRIGERFARPVAGGVPATPLLRGLELTVAEVFRV